MILLSMTASSTILLALKHDFRIAKMGIMVEYFALLIQGLLTISMDILPKFSQTMYSSPHFDGVEKHLSDATIPPQPLRRLCSVKKLKDCDGLEGRLVFLNSIPYMLDPTSR